MNTNKEKSNLSLSSQLILDIFSWVNDLFLHSFYTLSFLINNFNNKSCSASTTFCRRPKLPSIVTLSINFFCAIQIHIWIAGSLSTWASPIWFVDLPKPNIIRTIFILMNHIRISSTFMRCYAFTTFLVPWKFSTPISNIKIVRFCATMACSAVSWRTISTTFACLICQGS